MAFDSAEKFLTGVAIVQEREGVWRKGLNRNGRENFARTAGDLLIEWKYEKGYRWAQ